MLSIMFKISVIAAVLSLIFSPGLLVTLPPAEGEEVGFSGKTNGPAMIVHSIVIGVVFYISLYTIQNITLLRKLTGISILE